MKPALFKVADAVSMLLPEFAAQPALVLAPAEYDTVAGGWEYDLATTSGDRRYDLEGIPEKFLTPADEATRREAMGLLAPYRREALLPDAVRGVLAEPGDDICWYDVFVRLAWLVDVEFEPAMIPPARMKAQCDRFIDSLATGCPYATDRMTELVRENYAAKRMLRAAGYGAAGTSLLDTLREAMADL